MTGPTTTGENVVQFVCTNPGCGQTFRRRDYLSRHEAMHTDIRPYECSSCGKSFGRSDVLARHRKKCPAVAGPSRSASPHVGSPHHSSTSHRTPKQPRRGSREITSILSTMSNIESRLPLITVNTGGTGKRKRETSRREEEEDEDFMSDVSAESLVLRERASRSGRGGSAIEGENLQRGLGAGRQGVRQSRRMPILDVDFPVGVDKETVAAAMTLTTVEGGNLAHAYATPPSRFYEANLSGQTSQGFARGLEPPPLDMSWFGELSNNTGDVPPSAIDGYLPDAFFDFEAFLSSTLSDYPPASQILNASEGFPDPASAPSGSAAPLADSISVSPTIGQTGPIINTPQLGSLYYIPPDRFRAYYQMSHWKLPSPSDFAGFAQHAKERILPHFGFLHMPTFRLDMLATCLAFTLCTVGADHSRRTEMSHSAGRDEGAEGGGWDYGLMVRNEMTVMIMKSFSVTKRMTMSDYNLALNQSLLLLQASEILSDQSHERMRAYMFRTTIVNTARQLECYNPRSSHFRHEIRLPIQPWTFAELDLHWRRWIQLEVRRRTTYSIFIFDMLATIETGIPCICAITEVCYIPLPAPGSLWNAAGSESWAAAARNFKPISLDGALRILFTEQSSTPTDQISADSDGHLHPLTRQLDRFAMHVVILTLLRGVIEIGEGRRSRGDWYDLTDLWLERQEANQWIGATFNRPAGREAVLEVYNTAVSTWKIWWDVMSPSSSELQPSKAIMCEDALPIFWLVQALLEVLASSSSTEIHRAFITRINFSEMLASARAFCSEGSGMGRSAGLSSVTPSLI